jgi:hypothetical protein
VTRSLVAKVRASVAMVLRVRTPVAKVKTNGSYEVTKEPREITPVAKVKTDGSHEVTKEPREITPVAKVKTNGC